MNINLGNYLEESIKKSNYNKKELCNKLNELFTFSGKQISYTTFSNNIKNGEITLNEAIALATLIDSINLNKIVLLLKDELNKMQLIGDVENMRQSAADLLTTNSFLGATYEPSDVYEIVRYEVYEGLFISEDGKTVIMERIELNEDIGTIQQVANFTNFNQILNENKISIDEFKNLPLNEQLCMVSSEAIVRLSVLGEKMEEKNFYII